MPLRDERSIVLLRYQDIKIFGERNTSTRALVKLIELNSDSRIVPGVAGRIDPDHPKRMAFLNKLRASNRIKNYFIDRVFRDVRPRHSWKHAATNFGSAEDFADCFIIFSVRHPASWLLALHRRPYHHLQRIPETLEEFIQAPWKTVWRDRLNKQTLTPIELYNTKVQSYLDFSTQLASHGIEHVFLKFEDFAVNQKRILKKLDPQLINPNGEPAVVRNSTKETLHDIEFYKDYYGNEKWKQELDPKAISLINKGINWQIVETFGYQSVN